MEARGRRRPARPARGLGIARAARGVGVPAPRLGRRAAAFLRLLPDAGSPARSPEALDLGRLVAPARAGGTSGRDAWLARPALRPDPVRGPRGAAVRRGLRPRPEDAMSTLFTINFRREAYQREVARARRRVVMLGGWLAYFGVLTVVLGLYGLNCSSLVRRASLIERQAARMRALQNSQRDWVIAESDLATIEQTQANPRRWRDKLVRLAQLVPSNALIQSIAVNPDNLPGLQDQNKLV